MAEPTDTERLDYLLKHGLAVLMNRADDQGFTVMDTGCGCCAEIHRYKDAKTEREAIDAHIKARWKK